MKRREIGLSLVIIMFCCIGYFSYSGFNNGNDAAEKLVQAESSDTSLGTIKIVPNQSQIGASNDELVLLATSPIDSRAVILSPSGDSIVVSVGDSVGTASLILTSISRDKIVVRNIEDNATYFVYIAGPDGKSKTQVLSPDIKLKVPAEIIPVVNDDQGISS